MKSLNTLAFAAVCLGAAACTTHVPLKPSGSYVIFFDHADARIPANGKDVLEEIAGVYKAEGHAGAAIECFSDKTSDDEAANVALTQKRADRTKRDLVKLGVPDSAVTATGRGSSEALVPGVTGDVAVSNRRCTVALS
ncbi:Peptidoglycan-associated lipoprotein [Alphaproteobacteria bacterium SO-S41]|nr:Peptidoglycan-associated lipoprotein [Alphaproteobacteria bacterium SO-S41]